MEEYRVDIKVRNNLFLKKIESAGYKTIGEFLRINNMINVTSRLGNVINMKLSPLNFKGEFHPWLIVIADLLNCAPVDLFTETQMNTVLQTNKRSIQINEAEMKFMLENKNEPKSLEENILLEQQNIEIEDILNTLTMRERKILEMRFGMNEYDSPHTLKEIGKEFCIDKESVRQIEARALRKLRHPMRSDRLRDFVKE